MGLYHLLLNLWVRIFGESEFAVRSMSALFGALAVAAVYLLGVHLYGRVAGLLAGLLFALNAFIVQYAQDARSYSLLGLLVTLSSYFLVVELERPSKRYRMAYVISSSLAIYAHYFAAYVLIVQFATVVTMRGRDALKRDWLAVWAAILLLCMPAAIIAYHSGAGWLNWLKQPSIYDLWSVLVALAGGSWLLLIAILACGSYATLCAIREMRYWRQGFVAAWLLVPIALSFIVSRIQPMFLARYFTICVPALVLFGASVVPQLRRPIATGLVIALLVGLSAMQLAQYYGRSQSEDWRDATRYIIADTQPGDAIVFYPAYARGPFEYYQRQGEVAGPTILSATSRMDEQRIWLAIRGWDAADHLLATGQLQSSLMEKYRPALKRKFPAVEVELYVRRILQDPDNPR